MDIDERGEYLEDMGLHLGWNKGKVKCQICHDRWHSVDYETCYNCRPSWLSFDRREFSADQKIDIMERDDFRCTACEERDEYLQVDHIMPCSRGGEADVWNGQVLCSRCNGEKAGNWANTRWPKKRNELIHFYLTFGWSWLSYKERNLLISEASNKRELIGYYPLSGLAETSWLESKRKVVIITATPSVRFSGTRLVLNKEQGPVPPYINITSGQIEDSRVFWHGNRFAWHARVGEVVDPPEWAVLMADKEWLNP